ncbi:MAG: ABC transporter permease [Rhodospirillaceae bacterium]|nr:ABC transporter permease [Rhodospirillaceae bacterium]
MMLSPPWQEVLCPPLVLVRRWSAFVQFQQRAIVRQYKMSAFGFFWAALVPLITLGIYAFVFGTVMQSRWDGAVTASGDQVSFSIYLFAGLLVFWLLAQSAAEACTAVVGHANLVKKSVFPLEILPLTVVGAALFHGAINTAVLLAAMLYVHGSIPVTVLLFPVVIAPFILMLAGFAWILAALGAYFRDLNYVIGLVMTGVMFLSPVFYSLSRLGPGLQGVVMFNPISFIVIQSRAVLVEGHGPDWSGLLVYLAVAWVVAALGLLFFRKSKRNFADVL